MANYSTLEEPLVAVRQTDYRRLGREIWMIYSGYYFARESLRIVEVTLRMWVRGLDRVWLLPHLIFSGIGPECLYHR